MPLSMIHLAVALAVEPKAATLFLIGNLAPDCIDIRERKDKNHLRDRVDRHDALRELADALELANDFERGVLLHLYVDCAWDEGPARTFFERYGEGGFLPYRAELSQAGAWLYRHCGWSGAVWRDMEAYSQAEYDRLADFPADAIEAFIKRNGKWYGESDLPSSSAFTPGLVERFVQETAEGFIAWFSSL